MPNKISEEEKNNLFEQIEKHSHRRALIQSTIERTQRDGLIPADVESDLLQLELVEIYERINKANSEAIIPLLIQARNEEDQTIYNLFSRMKS
jgi:hypothetical protein